MSMKLTKYITPHRRHSQQITSPATGMAREPSASLRQCSDHGSPTPGSVPPLRRPGLAALPPLNRCAGHGYHILVAGIELRR
jgi:hypothetical protein